MRGCIEIGPRSVSKREGDPVEGGGNAAPGPGEWGVVDCGGKEGK